jgi:hypothetical protein
MPIGEQYIRISVYNATDYTKRKATHNLAQNTHNGPSGLSQFPLGNCNIPDVKKQLKLD